MSSLSTLLTLMLTSCSCPQLSLALAWTAFAAADSARVVRQMDSVEVRARLLDPRSSQTLRVVSFAALRGLPLDRLVDAIALQPGVVVTADGLSVRGGRVGTSSTWFDGMPLDEPIRHRMMEVPLAALARAELATGALEAQEGATLAGTLRLEPLEPTATWRVRVLWTSDARTGTHYDRASGVVAGPLAAGFGAVAAAEGRLDDTWLPNLRSRSRSRTSLLGGSFGWRADNAASGSLRIAPIAGRSGPRLHLLATRRVELPFDPGWTVNGPVNDCIGPLCAQGPGVVDSASADYFYRAADHVPITDDRRLAAFFTWASAETLSRVSMRLGWSATHRITSVGGGNDDSYLFARQVPLYGYPGSPAGDPFLAYGGDWPFFRRELTRSWHARADLDRFTRQGHRIRAGLGGRWDDLNLREWDLTTLGTGVDSLRAFDTSAPGAFGYVQSRWAFEGFVLNAGLRGEWFTPGSDAESQPMPGRPGGYFSLSPRIGLAYPISDRDAFSFAYARLQQDPARDFLYDSRGQVDWRTPLGNAGIEPATAITYEAALQHVIGAGSRVQIGVFYREWYDEPGARAIDVRNQGLGSRFEGVDAGHAGGVEATFSWNARYARGEVTYTIMDARGNSSLAEGFPVGPRFGPRPAPIQDAPLDWDRRHQLNLSLHQAVHRSTSIDVHAWIASGTPWTPREQGVADIDAGAVNSRRLPWTESTELAVHTTLPRFERFAVGLEVRNLFDHRGPARATLDGFPHPEINSRLDDYGAFRTQTGLGGAFWDTGSGSQPAGWVRVFDPRLDQASRTVRMRLEFTW
ncbi:MAG: TonB-dependent receptor [Candidatus Eisenbacteria bacterium]|uniref:TonB-dependent receptor n=1 Tax=Eiseniibacteriota bacterium TaxID=2212470 RepID=A0A849SDP5_UNCEI|nr:TonB-dependent receptor [Candidatus Eisenbacteria bacterium]